MRRRLIGLLALALLAAACTAGGGGSEKPAATIDPNANHAPLTLTVWSNFSARELGVTTAALKTVTQPGRSTASWGCCTCPSRCGSWTRAGPSRA